MKQIVQLAFLGVLFVLLQSGSCHKHDDNQGPYHNPIFGTPGPAGGIVFCDKGYYSNGWRYMEVTPFNIGNTRWGCMDIVLPNCDQMALGYGLSNTTNIVTAQASLDSCFPYFTSAAKLCYNYTLSGYSDWFLPSVDELAMAIDTLRAVNSGNFNVDDLYWTSTQVSVTNSNTGNPDPEKRAYHVGILLGEAYWSESSKFPQFNVRAVRRY